MKRNVMNLLKGIFVLSCVLTTVSTVQAEEKSMTVTYTGTSTYSVDIPASTSLKDQDGVQVGTYEVSVTGDFLDTEKLIVVPDETITMTETTNLDKADVNATVVQEKTEWLSAELTTIPITTGTITTVKDLGAGTWNGTVNFNISLEEVPVKSRVLVTGSNFKKAVPDEATSIVFTTEAAPSSVTTTALSSDGSDGVVGWLDGTVYKVSTQEKGEKVVFNEDSSYMFYDLTDISSYDFSNVDTSNVTKMNSMFRYSYPFTTGPISLDLSNFDTSNVTNMSYMFNNNKSIKSINMSSFNTLNVTDMSYMFRGLANLENLDVSHFVTSNVTNMICMFSSLSSLTSIDVSNFDTSKVIYMTSMFSDLSSLTSLDVSNFDTTNVIAMDSMFSYCSKLTDLDISNFNLASIERLQAMFQGLNSLQSLNLGLNFDTSNVDDLSNLFSGCENLTTLDLSGFNTSKVTDMRWMFEYCSKLNTIYVSNLWDVQNVSQSTAMFESCESLVGQNGTTYDETKIDKSMANYDTGYLTFKSK